MGWTGISPAQWADKTTQKIDLAIYKIALELFSRVILKTPVDTGRMRGNWQVAIGTVPDGTLEIDDKSGQIAINAATANAAGVGAGDIITLVNNLPYAQKLEDGSSKQAPAGMVALSVQEFQSIVRKIGIELVVI